MKPKKSLIFQAFAFPFRCNTYHYYYFLYLFLILVIGQEIYQQHSVVESFSHQRSGKPRKQSTTCTTQLYSSSSSSSDREDSKNDHNDHNNESKKSSSGFLPLPPIGESSFDPDSFKGTLAYDKDDDDDDSNTKSTVILDSDTPTGVALVGSAKFELQYTCNVCETKNSHKVSRLAYTKGVVITVCKGCMNRHLIADNLGWSTYWGEAGFQGKSNIEEFMDGKGRGDEVNRVSKEVFQLEKILDVGSPGGDEMDNSAFE